MRFTLCVVKLKGIMAKSHTALMCCPLGAQGKARQRRRRIEPRAIQPKAEMLYVFVNPRPSGDRARFCLRFLSR